MTAARENRLNKQHWLDTPFARAIAKGTKTGRAEQRKHRGIFVQTNLGECFLTYLELAQHSGCMVEGRIFDSILRIHGHKYHVAAAYTERARLESLTRSPSF
jgi:hypothetical protein